VGEPMWLDGTMTTTDSQRMEDDAHLPKSILKHPEVHIAPPSGKRVSFAGRGSPQASDGMDALALLRSISSKYAEGVIVSTNFGPNSAVILHLATRVNPAIPVVWVDTGYLSAETYCHAEQLTKLLNLNLKVYQPLLSRARMEAVHGKLWETDEREFGRLRKVEPMKRALNDLKVKASIVGLRRSQLGQSASTVTRVSKDGNERFRVLPIFDWSDADMARYIEEHGLPTHGSSSGGPRRDVLRYAEHGINSTALAKTSEKRLPARNFSVPAAFKNTPAVSSKVAISMDADVEVYTRINSALCKSAKKLLEEKNVEYIEYIVGADIAEDALFASIGTEARSAPYIFIGGSYVGGFNEVCERLGEDPRRHTAVWGRNVAKSQVGLV